MLVSKGFFFFIAGELIDEGFLLDCHSTSVSQVKFKIS